MGINFNSTLPEELKSELSILNFLVCYYIGCEKTRLDENDIELLHTLKDKIYTIKEKQYETV